MGRNGHSQDKDDALVSGFELLHPKPTKISKCSALGRLGSSFRCMGWRMLRAGIWGLWFWGALRLMSLFQPAKGLGLRVYFEGSK